MKQDDMMKRLRKAALMVPVLAMPACVTLAQGNEYKVVINHEEQYSIWLADQEMTGKWRETGQMCSLKACRTYIEEVWTDMRPLSLRKK